MAQPVDPFIPVHRRYMQTAQRPRVRPNGAVVDAVKPAHSQIATKHTLSPNSPGILRRKHSHVTLKPVPRVEAPVPAPAKVPRISWYKRVGRIGKYILLGLSIVAAGVLLQFELAGEILVGFYGIVAIIKSIPSRITLALSLVCIVAISALILVRPDPTLVKNFATYTLLFFFIGAISLLREART